MLMVGALLVGAPIAQGACSAQEAPRMDAWGITAVEGLELGHHTLTARPTGCTVILARDGAVGGVDVRGSAPGTREIALLDPVNTVEEVNAVVLSGAVLVSARALVDSWFSGRECSSIGLSTIAAAGT